MDADFFKLEYLIGPLVFVLLIFIALLLHELGHYMAARLFGMPIKSIVIGRGNTIKHWNDKHNTRWSIRRWPLGAHVHLEGKKGFLAYPFWQRALTILAGPLINFAILPFLFLAFYLAFGQPSTPAVLVGVEKGLKADQAGLQPGDRFLRVDGKPLANYQDVKRLAYSKGPVESLYTIQRGEKVFDLPFTPGWVEYKDEDGIARKNARFGVTWEHIGFKMKAIMTVGGVDVRDDPERARALLLKNLGKQTLVGVKGPDGKPSPFKVNLSKDVNANLGNPDHDDYKRVYLGATPGNIYLKKSTEIYAADALRYARDLIAKIAGVPFQLFPIDALAIKDSNAVTNLETKAINVFYNYLHLFAVASIVVGLVNLLPLPHLDGGQLLVQAIERFRKNVLTRRQKAKIFVITFLGLYLAVLFTNLDNVPGYIDSRAKKVHEFIDKQKAKNEEEAANG